MTLTGLPLKVNPIKSFLDDARWEAEDPHLLIDLTDFSHVRARQSVFRLTYMRVLGVWSTRIGNHG
jgi:hypothetical protein